MPLVRTMLADDAAHMGEVQSEISTDFDATVSTAGMRGDHRFVTIPARPLDLFQWFGWRPALRLGQIDIIRAPGGGVASRFKRASRVDFTIEQRAGVVSLR